MGGGVGRRPVLGQLQAMAISSGLRHLPSVTFVLLQISFLLFVLGIYLANTLYFLDEESALEKGPDPGNCLT